MDTRVSISQLATEEQIVEIQKGIDNHLWSRMSPERLAKLDSKTADLVIEKINERNCSIDYELDFQATSFQRKWIFSLMSKGYLPRMSSEEWFGLNKDSADVILKRFDDKLPRATELQIKWINVAIGEFRFDKPASVNLADISIYRAHQVIDYIEYNDYRRAHNLNICPSDKGALIYCLDQGILKGVKRERIEKMTFFEASALRSSLELNLYDKARETKSFEYVLKTLDQMEAAGKPLSEKQIYALTKLIQNKIITNLKVEDLEQLSSYEGRLLISEGKKKEEAFQYRV